MNLNKRRKGMKSINSKQLNRHELKMKTKHLPNKIDIRIKLTKHKQEQDMNYREKREKT